MNHRILLFLLLLAGTLRVQGQLIADFSSDIQQGCSPIVVRFQDRSQGSPTAWQWDFGNGGTSTLANPSATYINPGTYNVTLRVSYGEGTQSNTVTKTAYITVLPDPTPAFTADRRSGCTPAPIQFTDQSQPSGNSVVNGWLWDFGDGETSTDQNPLHVYHRAGDYSITLTITTTAGCRKLIYVPNYVNIIPGVAPSFTYALPSVCRAPVDVQFTNNSTGPGTLTYNWSFGDGGSSPQPSPAHTYTANDIYRAVLYVSSSLGCTDSAVQNIQVGQVLTDFIIPTHICPGQPVTFLNNSSPLPQSSQWTFSTGATDNAFNGQAVFPAAGTYTVTLNNQYAACSDSRTRTITIPPVTRASFTASDSGRCAPPLTVTFLNAPPAQSYQWYFGDGGSSTVAQPAHMYASYGDFDVKLVIRDTSGCLDSLTRPAYIKITHPRVTLPSFPHKGCIPETVNFAGTVTSSEPVVSWFWDFGDGSTSTDPTPQHVYSDSGSYTIKVIITTAGGCADTLVLPRGVQVGPKPTPAFHAATLAGCADPGIHFINDSRNATEYLWDFNDGSGGSIEENPTHMFADTGRFSIKLTAINNGCKHDTTIVDYVYIRPSVSKFKWKPDCNNPRLVTFTDASIGANSWDWDFGDGTRFTGQTPPPHLFAANGIYTVKLTTRGDSCSYTLTQQVDVYDPTPDFAPVVRKGCKAFRARFVVSGHDLGRYRKFIWDFGDGIVSDTLTSPAAEHLYLFAGNYDVRLTVIDSFGCRFERVHDTAIQVIGARLAFGLANGGVCLGSPATFLDSTVANAGSSIVSWNWDFGDSTIQTSTAPPFTHVYDTAGNYDVKLTVTDSQGCIDSLVKRDLVKVRRIEANFTVSPAFCPQRNLDFHNTTVSDIAFSSEWLFGDGGRSSLDSPVHAYADTGYYAVQLITTSLFGCRDTLYRDSAVQIKRPHAAFGANNFVSYCVPFQASFTDSSYFATDRRWSFGPGMGFSTQPNPYVVYTQQGTYPVKLVITALGGCQDSVTKDMVILDPSTSRLQYGPLSGCTPMTVNFSGLVDLNARFIWDFGDGYVTDTTVHVIDHRYTDFGDFVPRLIMHQEDGSGCTIALQGSDVIHLLGVHARFTLDTMLFCDQGTIHINSDSTKSNDPITNFNWTFGDSTSAQGPNPTHTYGQPGQYDVKLVVNTQAGCTDTMVVRPVKVVASPRLTIRADTIVCRLDRVPYFGELAFPDTSQLNWVWTFPNGQTSNQQRPPTQVYDTTGSFDVTAVVTNSSGCRDSMHQTLVVHGLPEISLASQIQKFVGVPVLFNAQYSSGVRSYNWTPQQNLSCSDCPQPIATPSFNTLYTVTATDSNNCHRSASVQVLVLCQGARVFVPNTFSPNGDGHNDRFFVEGNGLVRLKSLRVFNRWGEVVFEARDLPVNNPSYGWDGTYKGQKAAPDVYIYQVEVFCENSEVLKFEGNVALIR